VLLDAAWLWWAAPIRQLRSGTKPNRNKKSNRGAMWELRFHNRSALFLRGLGIPAPSLSLAPPPRGRASPLPRRFPHEGPHPSAGALALDSPGIAQSQISYSRHIGGKRAQAIT
jgi:hypothetical protein